MSNPSFSSLGGLWQGISVSENGQVQYALKYNDADNKAGGLWISINGGVTWSDITTNAGGDAPSGITMYGLAFKFDGSAIMVDYANGTIYEYANNPAPGGTFGWQTPNGSLANRTVVNKFNEIPYYVTNVSYPCVAISTLSNSTFGFIGFGATQSGGAASYPMVIITNDMGVNFRGCTLGYVSGAYTEAWGMKLNNNGTRAFYLFNDNENVYSVTTGILGWASYGSGTSSTGSTVTGWFDKGAIANDAFIDFAISGDGNNVSAITKNTVKTYHYNGTTWANSTTIGSVSGTTYHASTMNSDGTICYIAYKDTNGSGVKVYTMDPTTGSITLSNTISMSFQDYNTTDDTNPYVSMACSFHSGKYLAVTDFGSTSAGTGGGVYQYNNISVPCLTEGTRVKTVTGYMRIEDLHEGDVIISDLDECVRIRAIRKTVLPIVGTREAPFHIPANSIRPGLPLKDVRLSPDHLIHVGGDRWLTPRQAAKRNPSVIQQYGNGLPMTYYSVVVPNYFKQNLVIEDGVVVEACSSRGLVWDEDAEAFERVEKNENID